jgi:hypothetical protein
LPEEMVFAVMETIAESLMPGYYNRAMAGSMVDVSIFEGSFHRFVYLLYFQKNNIYFVRVNCCAAA